MPSPQELEREWTLTTAVARYEQLRTRESLADLDEAEGSAPLTRTETLELLALSEVIVRKAGYGRQLAVRSARSTGASWAQIGEALGTTRQSAWEAHNRWIDTQARHHEETGYEGLDPAEVERVRGQAGTSANEP